MNIRGFAGVAAIAATGLLAYGLHQLVPEGQPLTRSEVIGELDGPPLAGYSRTRLYRYGDRQYLTGQLISGERDLAGLGRAPVLDALLPAVAERHEPRRASAQGTAPALAAGRAGLALDLLRAGAASREVRNLVYGGRDNGRYALLGSIAGDTGVTLIGTPGQTLYLVTSTLRRPGDGDQPAARDVLRSDDQGATWRYDPEVALGAPQRHTMFLSEARAVALEDGADGERLLVSEDGARLWSALRLREQVWPDAGSYAKAFHEQAGAGEQLAYGWSLYPAAADRAVGWSWREGVTADGGARRIETRRFEVRFQSGASPAFRITHDVAPVPAQDPLSRPVLGQPVYATHGNRIFRLEPDQGNWHELAATPDVRGRPTWIGQAWFGRNGWVIQTYADHLFSFGEYTRTYFHTRDQGRSWRPFQLSPDQERGLLGLDAAGEGLLVHADRDGRTLIVRYALE
ncbi:hypothetical protein ACOTB3_01965 [Achromobacter xylosoxidans]|uniref:hypothetical protein n=1 Tax=Alcaligenes xylosoxydans xylosoxydans TaxID=85698 RepID=UPI00204057D0|nr:hypothetical protein [Achromobacter xylosoxidans]MCM2572426.1 hypothetical protein [Achromobacter xylosoxidans]